MIHCGEDAPIFTDVIQLAAFEALPTPTIVLTASSQVIVLNRACQSLIPKANSLLNRSVRNVPLRWEDGRDEDLYDLLACSVADETLLGHGDHSVSRKGVLKLEISILNSSSLPIFSARLLATNFNLSGSRYQILSFENVKEATAVPMPPSKLAEGHPPNGHIVSTAVSSEACCRPGARRYESTIATSRSQLDSKFSQLKEAIYFNNRNRAGFLLSADETFCFPNWNGSQNVSPVEIDDVELYFQEWDVWDWTFTERQPLSEYPALWLNKHRTNFRRRYGLKSGGKDLVLEAEGQPLYDITTNEYLGGVVWLTTLGEYEDVVDMDLKTTLTDFRNIIDRLPHLFWTVDPQGRADYFSRSWYEFTGFTEAESLGWAFQSAVNPDDMQVIWDLFAINSETKTEVQAEARYRRHDGQWIWMSVRAKPMVDNNGNILKWYGSSTQVHNLISERIVAEKQRAQMLEMLCLADIGLFEVTTSWQLKVIEGSLNWLEKQEVADVLTELNKTQPGGVPLLSSHLRKVMDDGRQFPVFEEQINSRWYKFRLGKDTSECSEGPNTNRILGCCIDITEQHERTMLESENARLVAEASMEVERNRLKTAFLAHMSHEIRTPIAGIIGLADMLTETNLTKEQRESVDDIQTSANNLLTIVNDILDVSKIEAGEMKFEMTVFDLHRLVFEAKTFFTHMVRGKPLSITCRQDLSKKLEMMADPGRVRQILTNLLSNSVKFTPNGSVDIGVMVDSHNVYIQVLDSGEGIDEQTMALLFRPFVQGDASTARRHGGTGLGLTISRKLAERMGGTLTLESKLGVGTKATLILPIGMKRGPKRSDQASPQPLQRIASREPGKSCPKPMSPTHSAHVVLIVEDNAINQKVAQNLVRKLGYQTEAVWNGQEALDYLADHQPPSLILMDCQMPLLDGYEATKRLRSDPTYQQAKSVPVIALTASAITGDQEKCQDAGMDDYLSKPVSKSMLKDMLCKWMPSKGG